MLSNAVVNFWVMLVLPSGLRNAWKLVGFSLTGTSSRCRFSLPSATSACASSNETGRYVSSNASTPLLPADEKYAAPSAVTASTVCASRPSEYMGSAR
jgi:hypothetical protein